MGGSLSPRRHSQLRVLVSAVALQVLADRDGLLDQVVQVLGDGRVQAVGLEDTQDLVAGDEADLRDTVRVTEDDTDLRRRETATGELEDLVANLLGGGLGPRRLRTTVRERRGGDTLSGGVHAINKEIKKGVSRLGSGIILHAFIGVSRRSTTRRPCACRRIIQTSFKDFGIIGVSSNLVLEVMRKSNLCEDVLIAQLRDSDQSSARNRFVFTISQRPFLQPRSISLFSVRTRSFPVRPSQITFNDRSLSRLFLHHQEKKGKVLLASL